MVLPFDEEDLQLLPPQLDCKYNPDGDGQHPFFTRANWREAVANDDTISGYWDWVYNEICNWDV